MYGAIAIIPVLDTYVQGSRKFSENVFDGGCAKKPVLAAQFRLYLLEMTMVDKNQWRSQQRNTGFGANTDNVREPSMNSSSLIH